ncbi:MAG: hypothetical protein SGI88_05185 [Candidatus Hydrogenedentes bacterium]|nr:hypothetical protein [Candidatus Hydrogenedentota bacterium]
MLLAQLAARGAPRTMGMAEVSSAFRGLANFRGGLRRLRIRVPALLLTSAPR